MSEMKVFLSYVADTSVFVEEFARYFFTLGGNFLRVDWLVENVDAGEAVSAEIAERIKSSSIFIAFICKDYPERMAAKELIQALELRKTGQKLVIVPVTLGHTGRSWWKEIKQGMGLGDIADQPFFKPGTNAWSLPDAAGVMAIQRLRKSLAGQFAA
jgi:TIR domain